MKNVHVYCTVLPGYIQFVNTLFSLKGNIPSTTLGRGLLPYMRINVTLKRRGVDLNDGRSVNVIINITKVLQYNVHYAFIKYTDCYILRKNTNYRHILMCVYYKIHQYTMFEVPMCFILTMKYTAT